jgi:hypothetical protein
LLDRTFCCVGANDPKGDEMTTDTQLTQQLAAMQKRLDELEAEVRGQRDAARP